MNGCALLWSGAGRPVVEICGQLVILARHAIKHDFRRFSPAAGQVILLDAGERVVPAFSQPTSIKAGNYLAQLGVTVREHAVVTGIDARGVTVWRADRADHEPDRGVGCGRAHRRHSGSARRLPRYAGR